MFKNATDQKWIVYAYDVTTGTALTGDAANITAKIRQDYGTRNATNDVSPTELELGYYEFDLTQAETNGDELQIFPESATGSVRVVGAPETVYTRPPNFPDLSIAATGELQADVTKVSGDAIAADNLEAQFDGTGYVDPTGPASRAQADGIGAGIGGSVNIQANEDNTGGAIIDGITFVGSVQGATTLSNTEAEDGVYHDIDAVGSDIDIVYGFSVGGGRTASSVSLAGFAQSKNNEIKIKVYDHVGGDWETIGTLIGSNGTQNISLDLPLLLKHTGTGAELGNVYIRFDVDSTTPSNLSIDKLITTAVNIGQSVGYANGKVWVDTVNGVSGTEPFVNGVADQAVDLWTSAVTIAASIGLSDFHIINGSTIVLTGSSNNFSLFGDNWVLDVNDQDIADVHVQGAHVSGEGTSTTEVHFEGCDVGDMSVQLGHFDFCSFEGTLIMALAGDYNYHDCYSKVPGALAPAFTKTPGQEITAQWRRWSGGLTLANIEAGDVFTISGEMGTVTLTGADGIVEIRGTYKNIIDDRTGTPTLNTDGALRGASVAAILAGTDALQADDVPGLIDTLNDLSASDITNAVPTVNEIRIELDANSTQLATILLDTGTSIPDLIATLNDPTVAAIVDGVWNAVLSSATYNINKSAGKRIRQKTDVIIHDGIAQGEGGDNNQIQLATTASSMDGAYDPALVVIIAGAGAGQTRLILEYNGTTKMATVDRGWKDAPDDTSEYIIMAHPGREHVNEGLAQAGTDTSITLNALASSIDGTYIGQSVFIRSGTGEDQARVIVAYNGTTKVATVDAWTTVPDVDSAYAILATHSGVDITAATIWSHVIENSVTAEQLIRGFAAALLGKASGMSTATGIFRDLADTKARITASVDEDGNRSAVTLDLT